ncbi:DUF1514 family protein [Staphylococcus warneri]|uniref:DUF1514 family protein n=1 Tax=Staphylococcus warneri TaxID=1292 RepID=UPI001FB24ED0|nr:DUF1514 family protein [Staphylococcus warneri]MCJ1786306.1 DUF1514 family protein [Staphylococcus warneri]MCJ1788759.1 DUF1514 family protein [Staphylococcus warneri]MCJ1791187.1 DUF1514 family protein [Staphylococcus warneri]MCJ1793646.1 DUF1514 family protein [Staphylococcus warneri]MCJ1796137.1 DUF1514 family protein [Staphylococcus warneri]
MWFIISILLAIALLISMGVQHEQHKQIEDYKYANTYLRDYIVRYIEEKRK